jgi:hypothetical protein
MLFQPKSGLSRREEVYHAIRDKPSDVLIPYDELPFDRETIIGLRDKVAKTFEREQQRTVVCVPNEGWKIVRGAAQVRVASRQRQRATRRLGRALHVIESTDRREMSAEERIAADRELIVTSTAYAMQRGLASKRFGIDDIKEWHRGRENGA